MNNFSDQLIIAILACIGSAVLLVSSVWTVDYILRIALLIASLLLSSLCIWLIW